MPAMKVCREPGCPALVAADAYRGRCPSHQRTYEMQRGTPRQRGYDKEHNQLRADLVTRMNAGETVHCWHCGCPLTPATLRLDHNDTRTGYRGAACDPCNSSIAGKASHGGTTG